MQPVNIIDKVYENREITKGIYRLSVKGEFAAYPGQFYMLRGWGTEPLLSRPISVHDICEGKISFLYEVRGRGTQLLSKHRTGDDVELLGPLGRGFDTDNIKGKVAVVTGGIGIAPMFYTAKNLKNAEVHLYAGFRQDVYIVEELKNYVKSVHVSTDNGIIGHKGYITDIFNPEGYSMVLCCGPQVMMGKVVNMCKSYGVPVFVSMERHMGCGIGACLVCTCKTKAGNKRVCKDGPVFQGGEVIFDA